MNQYVWTHCSREKSVNEPMGEMGQGFMGGFLFLGGCILLNNEECRK
jgi:hypothetical protein